MSESTQTPQGEVTQTSAVAPAQAMEALVQAAAQASSVTDAKKVEPEKIVEVRGMRIDLLEDAAVIYLADGRTKTVSLGDFVTLMNAGFSRVAEEAGNEIQLPKNCYFISTSPKTIKVSLYYPEEVRELHYRHGSSDRKYKVPVPNLVICVTLSIRDKEAIVSEARYFCTDKPLASFDVKYSDTVNHPQGLYLMPFSNVYEQGNLCTGENSMPAKMLVKDLRKLNWYHDVLFNSPFNNDLGLYALRGNWDDSVPAWYKFLEQEAAAGRKFPYTKLRGYSAPRS